jgi:hypothetical protein
MERYSAKSGSALRRYLCAQVVAAMVILSSVFALFWLDSGLSQA